MCFGFKYFRLNLQFLIETGFLYANFHFLKLSFRWVITKWQRIGKVFLYLTRAYNEI